MLVLNFNVREMGSVRRSKAAQPEEECEHIQTLNSPKCHRGRFTSVMSKGKKEIVHFPGGKPWLRTYASLPPYGFCTILVNLRSQRVYSKAQRCVPMLQSWDFNSLSWKMNTKEGEVWER